MDEGAWMKKWMKKIDPCKSDKSPLGYQQGIELFKTNILPIYKISKILIPSWVGF